ncbi:hypothetical protein L6452_03885 [Arctium lappa]|uniref:Uncharacterized protein n=1 Tax=Arctium lappa TaxID=4217 RepID=A0ACB9FP30_ARCLA|nr:hypothetical protein L6452_03885 [Arctium lappa]
MLMEQPMCIIVCHWCHLLEPYIIVASHRSPTPFFKPISLLLSPFTPINTPTKTHTHTHSLSLLLLS